jgi:hypothetical protein
MSSSRAAPLSPIEQKQLVEQAIPGRISVIRNHLDERSYSAMAVVALTSRALAGFLGIGRDRSGQLVKAQDYYEHTPGLSYEVKISDLAGGRLIDPQKLPQKVQKTVSDGILEANVGFAHLTFWASSADQTSTAAATDKYLEEQYQRVRSFAQAVIALWEISAKTIRI